VQGVRYFPLFCDLDGWCCLSDWEEGEMKEAYVRLADCLERVDAPCVSLADLHNFSK